MKNIAVVSLLLVLAACASTPHQASHPAPQPSNQNDVSAITQPAPITGITPDKNADIESQRLANEKLATEKLAAEIQGLQKQSVYFDFDKSAIKPEYLEVIQKQAAFLKSHKSDSVTVEGNADERGSDEYNLALGDRRASAVQKNLEVLGIPAERVRTVSFGEEKPRLSCHEEKCWQENRRADFVHDMMSGKLSSNQESPGTQRWIGQ